jgi:NAD(P)-dependent dehydrogenase (short-subunit alcohol dehydrogenase family)
MTSKGGLEGKTIIVTGSGRGIGRALALYLGQQGARVTVNDLVPEEADTVAAEIANAGGEALAIGGSVDEWSLAEKLVVETRARFGRIDGLVNNAGLHYEKDPREENEAEIHQLLQVNVQGAIFCGIHALRTFMAQGSGSLVNVTSGAHLGVAGQATYAASKGAIASLTYSWALDAMPHGVRVNAVAPLARTRMTEALATYRTPPNGKAPVREPAVLAPLFGYLLSDASAGITGQLLRFNGRELSLIRHPAPGAGTETHEHWDIAAIRAAMDRTFRDTLSPVGLGAGGYAWQTGEDAS